MFFFVTLKSRFHHGILCLFLPHFLILRHDLFVRPLCPLHHFKELLFPSMFFSERDKNQSSEILILTPLRTACAHDRWVSLSSHSFWPCKPRMSRLLEPWFFFRNDLAIRRSTQRIFPFRVTFLKSIVSASVQKKKQLALQAVSPQQCDQIIADFVSQMVRWLRDRSKTSVRSPERFSFAKDAAIVSQRLVPTVSCLLEYNRDFQSNSITLRLICHLFGFVPSTAIDFKKTKFHDLGVSCPKGEGFPFILFVPRFVPNPGTVLLSESLTRRQVWFDFQGHLTSSLFLFVISPAWQCCANKKTKKKTPSQAKQCTISRRSSGRNAWTKCFREKCCVARIEQIRFDGLCLSDWIWQTGDNEN